MSSVEVVNRSATLHAAVQELIRDGQAKESDAFEILARQIAEFQIENVPVVAKLAEARGYQPLRDPLDALPAVPTDVFRMRRVAAHSPDLDVRVFRTSGTTNGQRGAHYFRDLSTYELAALTWGQRALWPRESPERVIVLAPSSREVTDSSLCFMIDLFAEKLGIPTTHHLSSGGIDWASLVASVEEAKRNDERVLVLGTSFAFVFLLDGMAEGRAHDLHLPRGSRAMLTGGFKGKSREVDEPELRAMLTERLGLAARDIVGEYGMTELSSQLYESGVGERGRLYVPPPWMRVTAVDPVTLAARRPGEEGLCRIVDLANVDSAIAVQTLDWVRVDPGGVTLFGRAKGAEPRGCSLAIEEIFAGENV